MAANTLPIFTKVGRQTWGTLTAANTAKDGTGTTLLVFTSQADGSYIDKIVARTLGTNVASVARVFLNNGSSSATPANNTLYKEQTLPASTVSEVSAQVDIEVPLRLALPAGYTVLIAIGTAVAAGWAFTGVGGDY